MKSAPNFVTAGRPGTAPFQIETYDVPKRRRLIAEGQTPDAALAAAAIPPGQGKVTISVAKLNRILAACWLSPAELAAILNGK